MKNENETLKCEVNYLHNVVNTLQQKSLKKCVDIVGIPNVNKDNALSSAIKLLAEGLEENLSADDVESCYVKTIKSNNKSQSVSSSPERLMNIVCIKFRSAERKQSVIKNKRRKLLTSSLFGEKYGNHPIHINESLTKSNRLLLNKAKKIKIEKNYSFLWVNKGVILMRKNEGSKAIKICTLEDLENLF